MASASAVCHETQPNPRRTVVEPASAVLPVWRGMVELSGVYFEHSD